MRIKNPNVNVLVKHKKGAVMKVCIRKDSIHLVEESIQTVNDVYDEFVLGSPLYQEASQYAHEVFSKNEGIERIIVRETP